MVKKIFFILLLLPAFVHAQTRQVNALRSASDNTNIVHPIPITGVANDTLVSKKMLADSTAVLRGLITYSASGLLTYSGQTTWNGSAPINPTALTYRWTRVGDIVTVRYNLVYATPGSSNSSLILDIPGTLPAPSEPTGFTANSSILSYAIGNINTSTTSNNPSNITKTFLRKNSGGTAYEVVVGVNTAIAANSAWAEVIYFTNQ